MTSEPIVLLTAMDADSAVSDEMIEETLDWFEDKSGVPTEAFIDRLCDTYAHEWDLEDYDNPRRAEDSG